MSSATGSPRLVSSRLKKSLYRIVSDNHGQTVRRPPPPGTICPIVTVAWVAAESQHGWELGQKWIESKKELVATAGWSTLTSLVAIKPDEELELAELKKLVGRVGKTIHDQPNRVRSAMNLFLISVGSYVKSLTDLAIKTAEKIGTVEVDVGDTDCKVPAAADYIRKVIVHGSHGKKRKTAKC